MRRFTALKLIGLAILAMATLVVISILEVAVYAYMINPGQEPGVYDAHAQQSGPYISGIFGFILFFMVSRYWKKKRYDNLPKLVVLFPLTYVILDLIILLSAAMVPWSEFIYIFLAANGAKFLGSYLGYKLTK